MNALTKIENTALAAMTEGELVTVLQSSLYPGANLQSIKMVLGYCKAAGLDPMQKPVHIVPMWDKNAKQMRDVIMPGIGLYRTQAARSEQLAGISEPEFGPDKDFQFGEFTLSAPEWCRVTVKRLLAGTEREFTAKEFWIENYATAGKDTTAPNTMWKKRPRGQIAKCAQAQALRMAFPEMTGSQPTADEMDGKSLDDGFQGTTIDAGTGEIVAKATPQAQPYPKDQFDKNLPAWIKLIQSGKKSADQIIATVEVKQPLTDEQKATIRAVKKPEAEQAPTVTYAQVADKLNAAKSLDELGDAATLIAAVSDEGQRAELSTLHGNRLEELS